MRQHDLQRIGRRIASTRQRRGIGLRVLAEQAGVDYTWLHRLERGEWGEPDPAKIARVLEALSLRPGRQVTDDLADRLPEMPLYFRAKYDLTDEQVERVERYVRELRGES